MGVMGWMVAAGAVGAATWGWRRWTLAARLRFIDQSPLPRSVRTALRAEFPGWSESQCEAVERGLRQYFRVCAKSRGAWVATPSKAVDAAWHAFILDTRAYERFCHRAFGRLLHHTPAEALPEGQAAQRLKDGLTRAWRGACQDEGRPVHPPTALPLLFALDLDLAVPGGYRYEPDCRHLGRDRGDTHCATALSGCGGSGASDDARGSGDGADGGGDAGGGCGGD